MNKIIQRFLSQKCIGYLKNGGGISHSVIECKVRFIDGSEEKRWQLSPTGHEIQPIELLEYCPRIDIPQPAN